MNFSKKTQKQHQTEKFQKSPFIFTQLGLVLALLVVYLALEFTTEKKIVMFDDFIPDDEGIFIVSDPPVIIYEKKAEVKPQPKVKKVTSLDNPIIVPDDTKLIEQVLDSPIDDDSVSKVIDSIVEAPNIEEPKEIIDFIVIEEAPIYPGCEGLDSLAAKQCFTKKISKFVNKRFNTNIAERLNIVGRQRISVQFTIDKTGTITNIKTLAPHKSLEKEAIRVVKKLPQMTPGKQRKRPVGVKYTLPIIFFIE